MVDLGQGDVIGGFHIDMCPDCGAVPFQHPMDAPWFCDHPRERYVPVEAVPCDDAAVERVALLLFARSFVPMQTVEQVAPLWDDMEDDRREFLRQAAREVFRVAAGGE